MLSRRRPPAPELEDTVLHSPRLDLAAIDAAIIDLDGTLVDTIGDFEQALARTLGDLALPPVGREFIARTVGRGSRYLLEKSLAEAGGQPDALQRAWERYQVHYDAVNGVHSEVFDGVR